MLGIHRPFRGPDYHSLWATQRGADQFDGNADFTYHNLPEKRREVERDGFITSGDMGYFDEDDYLYICDRKRDMVISGGVNIYPAEIEAALQTLPGVRDCAVLAGLIRNLANR